jgi:siroheme synthase-like protein
MRQLPASLGHVAFAYPIVLALTGVPVLVVGGGRVAKRKVEGLIAAGAVVRVVAPEVDREIQAVVTTTALRPFRPDDLDGVRLAFTATDDAGVNAAVAAEATRRGIWVNSADDPANCTFILPAVAGDGAVTVAVSTAGSSPALASHLRAEIAAWLTTIGAGAAAETLAAQRQELHAQGISTESIDWSDRVSASLAKP